MVKTDHSKHTIRTRRRDTVVNTVKERPYTAAALATVAAGAAAFFLTRGKSDRPLMNWGQDTQGDDTSGTGATGGASPSAVQAANLAASFTSTSASAAGGTGSSTSHATPHDAVKSGGKPGDAGLDQTAQTEAKVGAISYGA